MEALGAVTLAAYRALPDFWDDEEYIAELTDPAARAAKTAVLVAVDRDGRVLGGVTYVPGPGELAWFDDPAEAGLRLLAVAPEAQERGVGTALVRACVERAMAAGKSRISLPTTSTMTAAHRIYQRLGFERLPDVILPSGFRLWMYSLDLTGGGGST